MKKFLSLKAEIVKSKNEPSLMQIYIDSIRSSCYKIVAPEPTKTPLHQSSYDFTTKIKSPPIDDDSLTAKHKNHQQFQQIFSQLQKKVSHQQVEKSQKIILNTIIQKLDLLQENKSLIPSIQKIKHIIYNMPYFQHLDTLNSLHSHGTTPTSFKYTNVHQSYGQEKEENPYQRSYQYDSVTEHEAITQKNNSSQNQSDIMIKYERIDEIEDSMEEEWVSLQKITQRQSQSERSSIKEQSIEFKKILYMLDSTKKQNNSNKKSYRKTSTKKQNLITSSRSIKEPSDKSKTIKDIVKMLHSKYNRNISFMR